MVAKKADAEAVASEAASEAMDFDANGWRPVAGDTITGQISDLTTGESEFGRYPIVFLQLKDGSEIAVHAFHHSLKTRLVEMRPKIGHTLTIAYLGEFDQLDRDGNPKMFGGVVKTLNRYTVESPEFEFNWERF